VQFFFGVLLAGTAACHSMSGDLRRGTAATVLSKPVSRTGFFLARFAGLALALLAFSALTTLATLIAAAVAAEAFHLHWPLWLSALGAMAGAFAWAGLLNYLHRRPFPSDAFGLLVIALAVAATWAALRGGAEDPATGLTTVSLDPELLPLCALIALALVVMGGIALAFSTRMELVPTVALCSVIFVLGLMSDYLFGRAAPSSRVAAALYAALPNWQHYWLADARYLEKPVPWTYVGAVVGHAAVYLTGVLALGAASFQRREVG
jgi:ABC-type transport system involved in multi-copper enzyme maturation permease subunit